MKYNFFLIIFLLNFVFSVRLKNKNRLKCPVIFLNKKKEIEKFLRFTRTCDFNS